jgi:hypothetical protein
MTSAKCQWIEPSEEIKGIPSRSAYLFFKPSRNSVTRQEESHAPAVDKPVQLIPPKEEAVATMGASALGMVIDLTVNFGGPLAEDFLQRAWLSE